MFLKLALLPLLATNVVHASTFYKGYDLSSLKIMEDGGAVYKDAQDGNVTKPVEDILAGMNTVRLRLWVNPTVPFDDGCE
jgi:arabinogalactan endo-1,4-beta-galactosidase